MKMTVHTKQWLLETLHDLAPADVARSMEEDGLSIADRPRATWVQPGLRHDPHENCGTAIRQIVEEISALPDDSSLVCDCHGLEALCEKCGGRGMLPDEPAQAGGAIVNVEDNSGIEGLIRGAALAQTFLGTMDVPVSLDVAFNEEHGYSISDILETINTAIEKLLPDGHRELF
jgi:hypothetical protein